ncbi:MAG: hypothetical protein AAF901_14880, partial [Bacteroidota bacterium]
QAVTTIKEIKMIAFFRNLYKGGNRDSINGHCLELVWILIFELKMSYLETNYQFPNMNCVKNQTKE